MVKFGLSHCLEKAQHFISPFQKQSIVNNMEIEILLVEDNSHDAEMMIRTLKKANLAILKNL